jgi:ankyrin repeat protein
MAGVWCGTPLQSVCRRWKDCYTEEDMHTAVLEHSCLAEPEWLDSYAAAKLRKAFVRRGVQLGEISFLRKLVFQPHHYLPLPANPPAPANTNSPPTARAHNMFAAAVSAVSTAARERQVGIVQALLACWPIATWQGRAMLSPGRGQRVRSTNVTHAWTNVAGDALDTAALNSDFVLANMLLNWRNQERDLSWPLLPDWQNDVPANFSDSRALQTASQHSNGISRLLMEASQNPAHGHCNHGRPLQLAIQGGSVANVHLLLNARQHPALANAYDSQALVTAVETQQPEILRLLLEQPSNAARADAGGSAALMAAVERGSTEMVGLLLSAPSHSAHADCDDNEPLSSATKLGHVAVTRLLLEAESHPARADSRGSMSLINAAENGCTETARLLLCVPQHAARADCRYGEALVRAAAGGHLEMVHMLLNAPQHAARADSLGGQALFYATENSHFGVVQLLLGQAQHAPVIGDPIDWVAYPPLQGL